MQQKFLLQGFSDLLGCLARNFILNVSKDMPIVWLLEINNFYLLPKLGNNAKMCYPNTECIPEFKFIIYSDCQKLVVVSWLCEEIETGFGFLILFCGAHIMILIELVFSIVSRGNCFITSHLN